MYCDDRATSDDNIAASKVYRLQTIGNRDYTLKLPLLAHSFRQWLKLLVVLTKPIFWSRFKVQKIYMYLYMYNSIRGRKTHYTSTAIHCNQCMKIQKVYLQQILGQTCMARMPHTHIHNSYSYMNHTLLWHDQWGVAWTWNSISWWWSARLVWKAWHPHGTTRQTQ